MELIFDTSNAVLPVFIVIFIGYILNKLHFFSDKTKDEIIKLVFFVGTPCLIFNNVATADLSQSFQGGFFLYLPF